MIALGTQARAQQRRRPIQVADSTFYKGEWMETGEDRVLSPTVFLAEQPPNYSLGAHFHRQNQFQLFVEGSGSLGRDRVDPVTVHYAGAYTGYGPLHAGPEGLKYFTIRPVFDTGFIPASAAREQMVRGPKRHAQVALGPPSSVRRLSTLPAVQDRIAMPAQDGLAVRHACLPPHAAYTLTHVDGSTGIFLFVLTGTLLLDARTLARWESVFATPDERPALAAGAEGAEIVLLHVPPTEPAYA